MLPPKLRGVEIWSDRKHDAATVPRLSGQLASPGRVAPYRLPDLSITRPANGLEPSLPPLKV